jgi:hypothetical protein
VGRHSKTQVSILTTASRPSNETHREHLYRVHNTPIECSRCWLNLKTEKDLADHVRKQTPCEVRPQLVEWIPREKIKVLKDRKKALLGQSERERWEYVYRILFPEEPSLPSPCKSPMI